MATCNHAAAHGGILSLPFDLLSAVGSLRIRIDSVLNEI